MYESTNKDIWRVFREHHYLTSDFNKGAKVYLLYWNDTLVGMNSVLNLPSASLKYAFRTHRLVILPDYQNLGLGTKFEEFLGEYYLKQSRRLFLRTSHLRLGLHCQESNLWKTNSTNKKIRKDKDTVTATQQKKYRHTDFKRSAYSFEYVGADYNTKNHQNIICIGDCDETIAEKYIDNIIDANLFVTIVTGVAKQSEATNTIWEKVAKNHGYRIEIAHINNMINGTFANHEFDCICTTKEAVEELKPYRDNINRYIAWNDKLNKMVKNF